LRGPLLNWQGGGSTPVIFDSAYQFDKKKSPAEARLSNIDFIFLAKTIDKPGRPRQDNLVDIPMGYHSQASRIIGKPYAL
jgi:hypothetical protein